MLRLRGSQAYSDFRINKLLSRVKDCCGSIQTIHSQYQHLINLTDDAELSDSELDKLEQLLTYGPADNSSLDAIHDAPSVARIYVVPRVGTISPWASKATDIAHHCGLANIHRIERGIAFYISAKESLDEQALAEVAALLHDPMTESVFTDLSQAAQLFESQQPQPLFEVSLLEEGDGALHTANQELGLALSNDEIVYFCLLYTSPSPRDRQKSRMPSSA